MQSRSLFLPSLIVTLAVWVLFSWPLPKHLFDAIPASARDAQAPAVRYMIPGDHLQFHYHLWLFKDMLAGQTPWFSNIYEFNLGDDEARFRIRSYYVPFSLVYAAFSWLGGAAFGWNAMGFITIWLSYWCMWALVRRYVRDARIAAAAALFALVLPYRWFSLFGGSPSGLALLWIPLLWRESHQTDASAAATRRAPTPQA